MGPPIELYLAVHSCMAHADSTATKCGVCVHEKFETQIMTSNEANMSKLNMKQ